MTARLDQNDLIVDVHMAVLIAEEQGEPFDHHLRTALAPAGGVFLFALPHPHGSGPSVAGFLIEGEPEPELIYVDFRQEDDVQLIPDHEAPDAWRAFARAHLDMMVLLSQDRKLSLPPHNISQ